MHTSAWPTQSPYIRLWSQYSRKVILYCFIGFLQAALQGWSRWLLCLSSGSLASNITATYCKQGGRAFFYTVARTCIEYWCCVFLGVLVWGAWNGSNLSAHPSAQLGKAPPQLAEGKGKRKLHVHVILYLFICLAHTAHKAFLCIYSNSCQYHFWGKLRQWHLDMLVKLQVSYFASLSNPILFLSLSSKQYLPDPWNQQAPFVSKFFCTGQRQRFNAGLVGSLAWQKDSLFDCYDWGSLPSCSTSQWKQQETKLQMQFQLSLH